MGARLVKFDFSPRENEQIDIVVNVPEDKRSVIHGIVKSCENYIIKDAVVKLFEVIENCNCSDLKPLTHTFTDDCGQFLFGPLCPGKVYAIKVWFNEVNRRELIISPEDNCSSFCLGQSREVGSYEENSNSEDDD